MPLIDATCATCDKIFELYRPLAMYPATPPCPTCGGATEQVHLPKAVQWNAAPVVVFQAPDGSMRFPGDANGLSAKNYEKQGFSRVEIRGAAEMRRFESHMNKREYSRAQRKIESNQQQRETREARNRSELRGRMQSMSPFGRAVARTAMERNDAKPKKSGFDAGFFSDVYSFDRSNREESRGEDGRRRRD
jgi:rRNA maturation endonuclease Nob1